MPHKPATSPELAVLRTQTSRESHRAYDDRRRDDPTLGRAARVRSSARWQRVREIVLRRQPHCAMCRARGLLVPATQVDHVVGLAEEPTRAYDPQNLQALCSRCHAAKSAQERRR